MTHTAIEPPSASVWMTRKEAAAFLRLLPTTLANWASMDVGPPYRRSPCYPGEDVDLSSTPPTVTVSGTLVEGRYFYRQDFPKTEGSERIYPITVAWASGMLLRRSANAEDTPTGAVFGTRNGTFWRPSNFRNDLAPAIEAADSAEAVTPHTFRRTVASQLAEWFNDRSAAIQLGHS